MRFRDLVTVAVVVSILAVGLAFALATRYPQAEILERAEEWPVAGPLVRSFRDRYLPAEPVANPAAEPGITFEYVTPDGEPFRFEEPFQIDRVDPDLVGTRPRVWAPADTPIYRDRDTDSPVLTRTRHLTPLDTLERGGGWFRVRYGAKMSGQHKGWVHLPDYREPTEEELWAPAAVTPLAAVVAPAEIVAMAQQNMASGGRSFGCGPYTLITDVEGLAGSCVAAAARAERVFRQRYGVEPVSPPAETIFVFGSASGYESFRDRAAPTAFEAAHAFPSRGYVALAVPGRSHAQLQHALLHELGHLVSRRALGPALPPWLAEGLADDLAEIGDGGARTRQPAASLPSIRELFHMEEARFHEQGHQRYEAAADWIAHWLDGPDANLAAGFRTFLAAVAGGERITEELLLGSLGRSWEELEQSSVASWQADGLSSRTIGRW